jgi:hypothetical protein
MNDSHTPNSLNDVLLPLFCAVVVVAVCQHGYFSQEVDKRDQTITYQQKQLEDLNRELLLQQGEYRGFKDGSHDR